TYDGSRSLMARQKGVWQRRLLIAPVLLLISTVLIVAPVWRRSRGRRLFERATLKELVYFCGIGAGFMLIEVGAIQKLRMIVGHPGIALGLTLSSVMLFAGLGSLASQRHNVSRRAIAITGAALAVLYALALSPLLPVVMALPRMGALTIAFFVPGPIAFVLG